MILQESLTEIGKLGKPHGINGEINAYIEREIDLDLLRRVVLQIDGIFVPFFIGSIRRKRQESFIVALDDVTNEREAAELTNLPLFAITADGAVLDDEEDDPDGFYASDLIGYTVYDDDSTEPVAEIEDFDDSTENVLFIARTPAGQVIYIPVADELITAIDTEAHTLTMSLPSGILDL